MKKLKELFSQLKQKLIVLFQSIEYSLKCFRLTMKSQIPKYEILQLAHRLEKGLLNENPKSFWGWEKAYRLASLISINDDDSSNRIGKGTLKAYIGIKTKSDNASEREKAISFVKDYPDINEESNITGGVVSLEKKDIIISEKEIIEKFFLTRHSCREFEDILVAEEDLRSAISLALKCPSACNRQVTNCYIYQSKEFQTIILTSSVRAFDIGEFNDWLISPSIFAGYLSLSLHLYGIGSCIYRKQLYGHHPYNELMRKKCNIPTDEIIVLELRLGYYKDEFKVAVSNRRSVDDVISFIKEQENVVI